MKFTEITNILSVVHNKLLQRWQLAKWGTEVMVARVEISTLLGMISLQ
jgi:hypothetical protein